MLNMQKHSSTNSKTQLKRGASPIIEYVTEETKKITIININEQTNTS